MVNSVHEEHIAFCQCQSCSEWNLRNSTINALAVPLLIGRNVSCPDLRKESEKEEIRDNNDNLKSLFGHHLQPPALSTDLGSMESLINDEDSNLSSSPLSSRSSSELSVRKLGHENPLLRTSFRRRNDSASTRSQPAPKITVSDVSAQINQGSNVNSDRSIDNNVSNVDHAKLLWKLSKLAKRWYLQLKEDFSETRPFEIQNKPLFECDESFSIKYTTDALNRFDDIFEALVDGPLRDAYNEFLRITQWTNPIQTMLTFVVLLHSLWAEYFFAIFLLALTISLLRNYIVEKGWIIQKDPLDIDNRRRPNAVRLTNLFQLNMRVTTALHMLTDILDKFLSLWTWKRPTITAFVLGALLTATVLSMFLPVAFFAKFLGSAIMLKVFILDYIFFRFPRVRAKYDILYIWYNELPTGRDIERQRKFNKSLKPSRSTNDLTSMRSAFDPSVIRKLEYKLSVIFNLSQIESLASGWELGKRCTLINKEKTLSGMRSGRLFLTEDHLLFMRYKTQSPKNLSIRLNSMMKVEKSKHSGWLPGDAQTLEVTLDLGSVYTFGSFSHRDEVYRELSGRISHYSYCRRKSRSYINSCEN